MVPGRAMCVKLSAMVSLTGVAQAGSFVWFQGDAKDRNARQWECSRPGRVWKGREGFLLPPEFPRGLYGRQRFVQRSASHTGVHCTANAVKAGRTDPLLLRVARGEDAERTPVWLMRQAGRYMADFRKYSHKYPFRVRSETPDIAIELSLQPWRAFQPDGVIMFSDILTPLPALGIEFDMVKGKGPLIASPIRSLDEVRGLRSMDDPDKSLPFIREILSSLRVEVDGKSTLLGFVGTPWTLAAYAIEGSADKNLLVTKSIMYNDPEVLLAFLDHLTEALVAYVLYQIDCGAQVIQLFDSWAHHLSPHQFKKFSLPYVEKLIQRVKEKSPMTPIIFHANGGTGKLHLLAADCSADVFGLDWNTQMQEARSILGNNKTLQGNVDPMVLFGPEEAIREAVEQCFTEAGESRHILNVGHGVIQGTPEESVLLFCHLARESGNRKSFTSQSHKSRHEEILNV